MAGYSSDEIQLTDGWIGEVALPPWISSSARAVPDLEFSEDINKSLDLRDNSRGRWFGVAPLSALRVVDLLHRSIKIASLERQ